MKVLFLSNLYPNKEEPVRATFNRQKAAHLNKLCEVVVVAPVAWFPFKEVFYNKLSKIPFKESIDGLDVYHPRVFYTPKIFRFLYGIFYFWSIRSFIKKLRLSFDFDLIFCSWVYPDGFAAMELAEMLNKPFVVLAHGSDLHFHVEAAMRRRAMKDTFLKAAKVIAVSSELKDVISGLGIPPGKIAVVYDGVDHDLFRPMHKDLARARLGLPKDKKIVLFVGNLVDVKGLRYLLAALGRMKDREWTAYLVGAGYLGSALKSAAKSLGIAERVFFAGTSPHDQIPLWLNAADILCLPSLNEGRPSIIIEALNCGLPVVASRVGGIPEIIINDKLGILVEPKDEVSLAKSLSAALDKDWDRDYISKYYLMLDWGKNSSTLFEIFRRLV